MDNISNLGLLFLILVATISWLVAAVSGVFLFGSIIFFGEHSWRTRAVLLVVLVVSWSFLGVIGPVLQKHDRSYKRMVHEHNLKNCIVRVEGKEYHPIEIGYARKWMRLRSGETVSFSGGVVIGCRR